jgi:uncharacterized membrane protein HdeD (DUF308 family)
MSLRTFITQERSRERWTFGTLGVVFLVYGISKFIGSEFSVAAFLSLFGLALLLAAIWCTERTLYIVGTVAVGLNIAVAALSIIFPQ